MAPASFAQEVDLFEQAERLRSKHKTDTTQLDLFAIAREQSDQDDAAQRGPSPLILPENTPRHSDGLPILGPFIAGYPLSIEVQAGHDVWIAVSGRKGRRSFISDLETVATGTDQIAEVRFQAPPRPGLHTLTSGGDSILAYIEVMETDARLAAPATIDVCSYVLPVRFKGPRVTGDRILLVPVIENVFGLITAGTYVGQNEDASAYIPFTADANRAPNNFLDTNTPLQPGRYKIAYATTDYATTQQALVEQDIEITGQRPCEEEL